MPGRNRLIFGDDGNDPFLNYRLEQCILVFKVEIQRALRNAGAGRNIFSRLYRNNARPIQPAGGRLIKEGR